MEIKVTSVSEFESYVKEKYPFVFGAVYRPMCIGMFDRLVEEFPNVPSPMVKKFLRKRAHCMPYYRAISRGGPRFALDGSECGEVSDEDQARAIETVNSYTNRKKILPIEVTRRAVFLKEYEKSQLTLSEYARKIGISLDETQSIYDKAKGERAIRHQQRISLVDEYEKSGLNAEQFAIKKKISLKKLETTIGKVKKYRAK